MKLDRNDKIALVLAMALGGLAIFGKLDWPAAVMYVVGWLQRQPAIVSQLVQQPPQA